ncbi:SlyX family protein [Maritimibacter fusiformis]|uniref:SlyX family protein n=1 Tax=Maritimibacter fusiformis TaxID=2603819 RepID=A0A5D0RRE6_9RHOB|nr:SlyX family protein [Maritimibacter fusiformis]TYB83154.1 SlyX family protein [Maritimibacter fusiformis]
MDDRITALEEQIAHLIRAVEDLSDVVARQDREIDRFGKRLHLLIERSLERDTEAEIVLTDQRPPHW